MSTTKRPQTLHSFFSPPPVKRQRVDASSSTSPTEIKSEAARTETDSKDGQTHEQFSTHPTYPFPIPHLPRELIESLNFAPEDEGRAIDDQPDLDLLYFTPYIPKSVHRQLFDFLRTELPFYRVKYTIKRGPTETLINTPRFTTVFGLDVTSKFDDAGAIIDAKTLKPVPSTAYRCSPRPMPQCLDKLRVLTENATGCQFNFALVNYYASGSDSISYHSDDEKFLGELPAIASFSLGAKRDFLLKHKPTDAKHESETKPLKFPLASGDMVLMRGLTQSEWLHSIPKRKSGEADLGRINITFRKAMVKGGTENYLRYNVNGDSTQAQVYKWDATRREMMPWKD